MHPFLCAEDFQRDLVLRYPHRYSNMTEEQQQQQQQQAKNNNNNNKKVKRKVAVIPPCPSSVSTAVCILRAAVAGVTGASLSQQQVSLLQATYVKDHPKRTGKFAVQLGKKWGDCALDLPDTPEQVAITMDAIEQAANRMIAENHDLVPFVMTKDAIVEQFGGGGGRGGPNNSTNGVLDASHNKTPGDAELTVVYMNSPDNPALLVPPSMPLKSTGQIESIHLERTGNMACNIVAGKKCKKAEITLKFEVKVKSGGGGGDGDDEELAVVQSAPEIINMDLLQSSTILCPEGIVLAAAQAAKQEAEIAVQAARQEAEAAPQTTTTPDAPEQQQEEVVRAKEASSSNEMVVDPFNVAGKIDYTRLVEDFGSTLITDELMKRLEEETVGRGRVPYLHRFLRRGMFFSHRDLDQLLKLKAAGTPMYLYTGRGPSSGSMHLGHLIPFLFTKWLQDALDVPLVIQMTDDEKFLFKGVYEDEKGDNLDYFASLTIENAKDIIACGFDYNKTFLFSDLDYIGSMYPNVVRIWKAVTTNTVSGIFGFTGSSNTGQIAFPAVQAAPSFASSFPTVLQADRSSDHLCLIPCAIDQDPYFRMTRDVAHKLVHKKHGLGGKPALIHSKFFPPLQGAEGKMSSSDENSAIFLTDTPELIEDKIKRHAFSGGRQTKAEQQELGADLEVDVAYQWLRFFLEDDEELAKIAKDYGSGSGEFWSTMKVKERLIEVLKELVGEHQERRTKITDEEVRKWMVERSIV